MRSKVSVLGLIACFCSQAPIAQAQMTLDVSRITCAQYVQSKVGNPRSIAAWLSGYYGAKRDSTVVDLKEVEEKVDKLQFYCENPDNAKVLVMKALGTVTGTDK